MSGEADQLRATLASLREQLAALDPASGAADPEVRAHLESALVDIHALLDAGAALPADDSISPATTGGLISGEEESIIERLSTAERHFESTHPTLSGIVGSIISALSRMGI